MTDQKHDSHTDTQVAPDGHQKQKDDEHKKHGGKHNEQKEEDEDIEEGGDKKVNGPTPGDDITTITAE